MNKGLTMILITSFIAAAGLVASDADRSAECALNSRGCIVQALFGHLVAASAGPVEETPLQAEMTLDRRIVEEAVFDGRYEFRSGTEVAALNVMSFVSVNYEMEFDGDAPCRRNEHPAG